MIAVNEVVEINTEESEEYSDDSESELEDEFDDETMAREQFPYQQHKEHGASDVIHIDNLVALTKKRRPTFERIRTATIFQSKVNTIVLANKDACLLLFAKAIKRYTDYRMGSYKVAWMNWQAMVKQSRRIEKRRLHFTNRLSAMRQLRNDNHGNQRDSEQVKDIMNWMVNEKVFPREVPSRMLEELCKHMTIRVLRKGETVFLQGDRGDCYYIIIDGNVDLYLQKVEKQELALRMYRDKDWGSFKRTDWTTRKEDLGFDIKRMKVGVSFGELSLLNDEYSHRSCTAVAANPETQLCVIDRSLYNRTLLKFHKNLAFMRTLTHKIGDLKAFKSWTQDLRQSVLDYCTLHTYMCGSCLFQKYDKLKDIVIILEGEVALVTDGVARAKGRKKKNKQQQYSEIVKEQADGLESIVFDDDSHPHHMYKTSGKQFELCRHSTGALLGDVESFHHIHERCTWAVVKSHECVFLILPVEVFMKLAKSNKNIYNLCLNNAKLKRNFEAKRFKEEVGKHKRLKEETTRLKQELNLDQSPLKGRSVKDLSILDKIKLDKQIEKKERHERIKAERKRELPGIVRDHMAMSMPPSLDEGFKLNPGGAMGGGKGGVMFDNTSFLSPKKGSAGMAGPPVAPMSDPTFNRKRYEMQREKQSIIEKAYPWKMTRGAQLRTPSTAIGKGIYSSTLTLNTNKMNLYKTLSSVVSDEQKTIDLMKMAAINNGGKRFISGVGVMRPKTGISKIPPI